MNHRLAAVACVLALAGCAGEAPAPDPNGMAIAVALGLSNLCSNGVSPKITVSNPPPATAKYAIEMRNIDVLFPSPWQGTVIADGAIIPEGAGADYRGPCEGEFQRHRYRFTVTALDAGGRALAQAQSIELAAAASAYVQRNALGIAQPPLTGLAVRATSGRPGPDPTLEIAPILGVAGWRAQSLYREPDDPVFRQDQSGSPQY
jgi:hypothetical protein